MIKLKLINTISMKHWSLWLLLGVSLLFGASCGKEPEPQPLPQPVKVTGVTMNSTSLTLVEGETAELVATISPKNADNQTVLWSSSDGSVASVDNGKVTALKEGKATITAKSDDGGFTATCSITVNPKTVEVTSVTLSKAGLALTEGESETLIATVNPEDATDKSITWSSSDTSIATVEEGKITALKEGSATITARAGDKSATCEVTVAKKVIDVESIELSDSSLNLTEGESMTLTATVKPDNATDKSVTWTSSDPSIASVNEGKVTAIKEGETTITAKSGDKTATCVVTVEKKVITVESIELSETVISLTEGETKTIIATVKPDDATDKTVTWTCSDSGVAIIENGEITAVNEGKATIIAKAGDKIAKCEVTVIKKVIAVTSVSLNKTALSLVEGQTAQLYATVKPENASDKTVTWSSSDKSVVSVNNSGLLNALKAGTVTITASCADKTATCKVNVSPATIPVTGVSIDRSSLSMVEGETQTLTATISPSNATDKSVSWSSDNTSVATVSSSGVVSANAAGSAKITVRTNNGHKTAECYITVSPAGQYVVFNDPIFKAYCIDHFDDDNDGIISIAEAATVTYINVCFMNNITSLKGIEYFTSLVYLDCSYNQLTSLDLSKNTQLGSLACSNNQLTSLDLSKNTQLSTLYCNNNQLTSLDVSNHTMLYTFNCNDNQLTSLDISKNTPLHNLVCYNNQLTSLDVSKNTHLYVLGCGHNQLTRLDVSNNLELRDLACECNQLTSLDLSNNYLETLYCNDNQLTTLDVSNNIDLKRLWCYSNPHLTEIWFKTGQIIEDFRYNWDISTVKYKD